MMRSRWFYLLAGGLLVGAVLFVAIFAEHVTPVSPYYMDERTFITDGKPPFPPGGAHPLGTDEFGRDVWSRVAYGSRWSLLFAALIMGGRLLLAVPFGIAGAFGPRIFNWLIGRLYVFTSAIPPLVVYLAVLSVPRLRSVGLWPSVAITVVLLSLVEWPRVAVFIQGRLEELSGEQFVEGAIATGATRLRIFWRHLMPHLWATFFQLVAAEMGRGLLVIAQLGIFGIWVGGGITEVVGYPPQPIIITGIPEWGTLLAEARSAIRNTPWIPMAPAMAFLVGVVGFHLLSQGLDGLSFSLYRLREATTSRISAWWRLALIPLIAIPIIFWWQVKTRDDAPAFMALAQKQTEALTARDIEGYMATISDSDPDYKAEQRRWIESLMKTDYQVGVARPLRIKQSGNSAVADWALSFGYETRRPVSSNRGIVLERIDGKWYETRGQFQGLRGFHTDTYAVYDPIDGSQATANLRWAIRKVSTLMDRAYVNANKLFPPMQNPPRPRLLYFRSDEDYKAVVEEVDKNAKLSYTPGEALRVAPAVLNPYDPWELENLFTRYLTQVMTFDRLGKETADPVGSGLFEVTAGARGGKYWLNTFKLEGRLYSLPELYALPLKELKGAKSEAYYAQTAILAEYLQSKGILSDLKAGTSLADLAAKLRFTEEQLIREHDQFLRERIMRDSMLSRPEWRDGVPMDLVDAMSARASAVGSDAFLDAAAPDLRAAQAAWQENARSAGLTAIEAQLIDVRVKEGTATVLVLERYSSGTAALNAVVTQTWQQQNGRWILTAWNGPAEPLKGVQ